jgi:hypothetical protein
MHEVVKQLEGVSKFIALAQESTFIKTTINSKTTKNPIIHQVKTQGMYHPDMSIYYLHQFIDPNTAIGV